MELFLRCFYEDVKYLQQSDMIENFAVKIV